MKLARFIAAVTALAFTVVSSAQAAYVMRLPVAGMKVASPAGVLTVAPAALSFGAVDVGQTATRDVVLANNSAQPIELVSVEVLDVSSGFHATSDCGASLSPGEQCTAAVAFTPSSGAASSSTLSVLTSSAAYFVDLSGNGTAPHGVLSAAVQEFGDVLVGQTQRATGITLTNVGTGALRLSSVQVEGAPGDFGATDDCGAVLSAGEACSLEVSFTPSQRGAVTATVAVDMEGQRLTLEARGRGIAAVGALTADVSSDFGQVLVGSSQMRQFTFTNVGDAPASAVAAAVQGSHLRFAANSCGTSSARVSLAPGQSCGMTVVYEPLNATSPQGGQLSVEGSFLGQRASLALTSESALQDAALDKTAHAFADTWVGEAAPAARILVTNAGTVPMNVGSVALEGADASSFEVASACAAPVAPGQTCAVDAVFKPATPGAKTASIRVQTDSKTMTVALTGRGVQAVGALVPATSADFGDVSVGTSVSRHFTFTNSGDAPASDVQVALTSTPGLSIASNTCATTVVAGASCSISVTYAPTSGSALSGASLSVAGKFVGSPASLALSGSAQLPSAAWSSTPAEVVALTDTDRNFGVLAPGSTAARSFYLLNVSKGSLGVGFALAGDTAMFRLEKVTQTTASGVAASSCKAGGQLSGDGLSTQTPCQTADATQSNSRILVQVRYTPSATGTHSVQLALNTDNNTVLPAALTLVGSSQFDAQGAWSTSATTLRAPTTTDLDFGYKDAGTTNPKSLYLRNVGTVGAMAVGFTLTGDTDNFVLTRAYRLANSGGSQNCISGGTPDVQNPGTLTTCVVDPAGGAYPNIRLDLQYKPVRPGTHTVALTPFTANGTALPQALTLTGKVDVPQAAWSINAQKPVTPLTAENLAFSATSPGRTLSKTFFLQPQTTKAIAVGFELTGDTSQFRITEVRRTSSGTGGLQCTLRADYLATQAPCYADAPTGNYPNLLVTVAYNPTVTGDHSVRLALTTGNGTQLPADLTLQGTSVFDAQGAWSSSPSVVVQPSDAERQLEARIGSTAVTKTFYLKNLGSSGRMVTGFALAGDTAFFRIVSVYKADASGAISSCGTAPASDGLSTGPCSTDAIESNLTSERFKDVAVTVQFQSWDTGRKVVTLVPTATNGAAMPTALSVSGTVEAGAVGVWSKSASSTVALAAADLDLGTVTVGGAIQYKDVHLRNSSARGIVAAGFRLVGDTEHFRLQYVMRDGGSYYCYPQAAVIAADGLSSSTCHLTSETSSIAVRIAYNPTTVGQHSVQLVPETDIDTVLPAPLTFSGTGVFDAQGVWSMSGASEVPPSAADLQFESTVNSSIARTFYLKNIGTYGALSARVSLRGDTEHFKLQSVAVRGTSGESACPLDTSKLSTATNCVSATYIAVAVLYAPTAAGTHTVQMETVSSNGSTLPAAVTLTGTGYSDTVGTWSSSYGAVALQPGDTTFGPTPLGTPVVRKFYVHPTGDVAQLSLAFSVQGGGNVMKVLSVSKVNPKDGKARDCGVTLQPGGATSTGYCVAEGKSSQSFSVIEVEVQYLAQMTGTRSIQLVASSADAGLPPTPLTLTGTAN
ncbi:hypothetical protein D3C71_19500 [compost metagenome]